MAFEPGLGSGIEHIVVLMFENRSFDNLLGTLYPAGHQSNGVTFDGLPLDAFNLDFDGNKVQVWTEDSGAYSTTLWPTIPDPDPGERFQNVNYQLYGGGLDPSTPVGALPDPAPMSGFVKDYTLRGPTKWIDSGPAPKWPKLPREHGGQSATAKHIMHYFATAQVPVMSQLAKQYAVCDEWFCSVPTQTFANRMFALASSSDGGVDDYEILKKHLIHGYPLANVLHYLDRGLGDGSWRIYYDKDSYSISELLIEYVHDQRATLRDFNEHFAADVESGLPAYTFIEPNYGHKILHTPMLMPNSYHPPYDVVQGERFLWTVYDTLKSANEAAWAKTLFIVTFDEHGGCYDHVPPPAVPPAAAGAPPFDRYGVRVPTLLISPLIEPGTIFRATSDAGAPLDHCALTRTVFNCFLGRDVSLTARDAHASDVSAVLRPSANNPGLTAEPSFPPSALTDAQLRSVLSAPNHLSDMWSAHSAGTLA